MLRACPYTQALAPVTGALNQIHRVGAGLVRLGDTSGVSFSGHGLPS